MSHWVQCTSAHKGKFPAYIRNHDLHSEVFICMRKRHKNMTTPRYTTCSCTVACQLHHCSWLNSLKACWLLGRRLTLRARGLTLADESTYWTCRFMTYNYTYQIFSLKGLIKNFSMQNCNYQFDNYILPAQARQIAVHKVIFTVRNGSQWPYRNKALWVANRRYTKGLSHFTEPCVMLLSVSPKTMQRYRVKPITLSKTLGLFQFIIKK